MRSVLHAILMVEGADRFEPLVSSCRRSRELQEWGTSIPFATDDNLGSAFVAVVVYPRHINLAFNRGAEIDDPKRRLVGTGARIRHVRIDDESRLDAAIAALVRRAARHAGFQAGRGPGSIAIKSIYARQRPRRPRDVPATGRKSRAG